MSLAEPESAENPSAVADPDARVATHVRQARGAFDAENYEAAIRACERLLAERPGCPEALLILGLTSWKLDEPVQSIDLLRRAHAADGNTREYADALATLLAYMGDSNESLYYAKLATVLAPHPLGEALLPPNFTEYFKYLHFARPHIYRTRAREALERGAFAEAIDLCEKQLELTANEPDSLRILAQALIARGQLSAAIEALHTIIGGVATAADYALLADALSRAGRFDEALLAHELAEVRNDSAPALAAQRLETLARRGGTAGADYLQGCRDWFARFDPGAAEPAGPANAPDPDRDLRLGFVGANFHAGADAPVLERLARHLTGMGHEVYVYDAGRRQDMATQALTRQTTRWTDIAGIDPETAAEIMRRDAIDIAIDMSGMAADSQLLAFTCRPAPVRLGWLGPMPGIGTPALDAHLIHATDDDGPVLQAAFAVPTAGAPAIDPAPPCAAGAGPTFGICVPLWTVGSESFVLCKPVLDEVPDANLIIANSARNDDRTVSRIYGLAGHAGLADRVTVAELESPTAPRSGFFAFFDVVLDSGRDEGFVEAAEALWMGVPVLALTGTGAARALAAAGREDWIFDDAASLAAAAGNLAGDTDALRSLRQGLRIDVAETPLFDSALFAADFARVCRAHWRRWCAAASSQEFPVQAARARVSSPASRRPSK